MKMCLKMLSQMGYKNLIILSRNIGSPMSKERHKASAFYNLLKLNIQNRNWYCQILDDMCHIYNILFTLLNIKIETNKLTSSQRRIFVSTRVCNCLHNSLSGKFVDV